MNIKTISGIGMGLLGTVLLITDPGAGSAKRTRLPSPDYNHDPGSPPEMAQTQDPNSLPPDPNATPDPNAPPNPNGPPPPGGWDQAMSDRALMLAANDDAGAGYCAMGVANIMEGMGYPVTRGNAYTWSQTLPQNGWVLDTSYSATTAPAGAILVYDRSTSANVGGGAQFGHVEVVTYDSAGNRKYTSDKARTNWGGSVPQNFVGVYVYKG